MTQDDRRIKGEGTPESAWQAWGGLEAMACITHETLVAPGQHAVIVAPHPDDETLGFAGLMLQLAAAGHAMHLIAVTDGTASHAGSPYWSAERLARQRPQESLEALSRLGCEQQTSVERLGLPDTAVAHHESALADHLAAQLTSNHVVLTTWRGDGHPDHEATGRACARACELSGAHLIEIPIWCWHWAAPGDTRVPWHRARRLGLDADMRTRKQAAIQAHESQLKVDPDTGQAPILPDHVLSRLTRSYEVFFIAPPQDAAHD
ncbi:acetylglucosaminylphosphatidylinositol deacetylase [Kushneria pakistanensis]|uniref:Acetylglucosaminylphosphatidylinositol deacetylase n=1 Tax=Kushneria pakistanensis TaxID=1508770 RepID=A0ABQ3FIJ1_9GAMM|nr:PIG-L deacetylase family protein [Kushneria pakistanensis]GHC25929.1 acetylglucosaminylphosphatidylinositol deacetylase [Kushneria pakistanensis]